MSHKSKASIHINHKKKSQKVKLNIINYINIKHLESKHIHKLNYNQINQKLKLILLLKRYINLALKN